MFGRVETIAVGGQGGLDPADQEPGRRERGPAHAAPRGDARHGDGDGLDLWIALNDRIADGRDVSWVWDADFELLAGAVAARRLRRDPGAGDGGAAQVRRARARSAIAVERVDRALARPGASPRPSGALFALPTYTALIELRTLLADARPRDRSSGVSARRRDPERDLARRRVRRLRRRPPALGRSSRARRRRPVARARRRHRAASRCTWPRAGHRRRRARSLDAGAASPTLASARAGERRSVDVRGVCADAREPRRSAGAFALILAPMQLVHLLGGAARPRRRCSRRSRAPPRARRHVRRARCSPTAPSRLAARPGLPLLPDVRERRRLDLLEPAARGRRRADGGLEVRRLRQTVSPDGELSEELRRDPARRARRRRSSRPRRAPPGLRPRERLEVAATDDHVGSTVVRPGGAR